MKNEEEVVVEEKKKTNWGKVFLCSLLVVLSLIAVFFMATYLRWAAEIGSKNEILYYGQEEVKIDKLYDFYGTELATELQPDTAILMYCTSEYGKECITPDLTNVLENNLRSPLLVINIIVVIDLLLIYVLLKDRLRNGFGKYILGAVVLIWGLVFMGMQVFKVADYYKLIKDNPSTITGNVEYRLLTNSESKYVPVINYTIEEEEHLEYFDFQEQGSFEKKEIELFYNPKDKKEITPKKDMKKYIIPGVVGLLIVIEGFMYLFLKKKIEK